MSDAKRLWVPCVRCGKKGTKELMDEAGLCPRCLDPDTYALCQRINEAEREWLNPRGANDVEAQIREKEIDVLVKYDRGARRRPSASALRAMLESAPANNGKRGGGPNNKEG